METKTENILVSFNALGNCEKSGNWDWFSKHGNRIELALLDVLPHGSGIDCKWGIELDLHSGKIVCKNSFHNMNDNGSYSGYTDFQVIINANHRDIFGRLDWTLKGRFAKRFGLKDYLEDTIGYALESL